MGLRKALIGMLFTVFFFLLCQGGRLVMLHGFAEGSFSCNVWGAFGLPFSLPALFFLMGAANLFFVSGWWQADGFSEEWPWLLLIAGGASNIFERIAYGCVTDYLSFGWFPSFNVADGLLTLGVVVLIWKVFFREYFSGIFS